MEAASLYSQPFERGMKRAVQHIRIEQRTAGFTCKQESAPAFADEFLELGGQSRAYVHFANGIRCFRPLGFAFPHELADMQDAAV